MKHVEIRDILSALNSGEFPEHIESCDKCAEKAAMLKEFQHSVFSAEFVKGKKGRECLDAEDLAELLEGAEIDDRKSKLEHIRECDYCMANAAYYFSESTKPEKWETASAPQKFISAALEIIPAKGKDETVKETAKEEKGSWLRNFIFSPAPAYIAILAFWVIFFVLPTSLNIRPVSGGDKFVIYKNPDSSKPYFYFSNHGDKIGERPTEMRIIPGKEALSFFWDKVEGATEYHFIIQDTTELAPKTVTTVKTTDLHMVLPVDTFESYRKYKWIVAGGMPGDTYFVGEFNFQTM